MTSYKGSRDPGPAGPARPAQPYLDWAIATRFVYLRAGDWLPLLVEFDKELPREQFTRLGWLNEGLKPAVRVPELFDNLPHAILQSRDFNFGVLLVLRQRAAEVVNDASWNRTIRSAELGPPVDLADKRAAPAAPVVAPVVAPVAAPGAAPTADAASSGPPAIGTPRRWINAPCEWLGCPSSAPATSPPAPPSPCAGQRVVVAVIDQGIAFAHPRFSTTSGTRIAYLWQQDPRGVSGMTSTPGVELTAAAIDAAVQAAQARGADEDMVYRTIGGMNFAFDVYKPLARRRSHGTHVLDLAAGNDPNLVGADLPIIAVDMPEHAVGDPAGSKLVVHAIWGLLYILSRAQSMLGAGETLPVVVNISYGPHDGPHDGSALFERVADTLTILSRQTNTPLQIVLAAGNFRQSRVHANFRLQPLGTQKLQWRLQPVGLTPSFLEVWLAPVAGADVTVTLRSPKGPQVSVSAAKLSDSVSVASGRLFSAQYLPASTSSPRTSVVLSVAPTAHDPWGPGSQPVARSGLWSVEVTNTSGVQMDIDAWIKRSDTPGGRRAKGRQSFFDDPAYQRHDTNSRPLEFDVPGSYVKRQGTLSGIATGSETYVIGAYRRGPDPADLMPADYASEGPVAPNALRTMNAPNWLAPGDDGVSCQGVLAAGTRSGARVAMRGSSVAAPQATRYYAGEFAAGNSPGHPSPGPLQAPSKNMPIGDEVLVAGDGLMLLRPPVDRVWKDRP